MIAFASGNGNVNFLLKEILEISFLIAKSESSLCSLQLGEYIDDNLNFALKLGN